MYDPRYTWGILDGIEKGGGIPLRSRVGHSFIKKKMREENGIFCGEASGHTYFRDFYFADSGIIPFLLMLEILSESPKSLDEIMMAIVEKYPISGETSLTLQDRQGALARIREKYSGTGNVEEFDNLIVEKKREWRFNIRVSNTEPLLRINIEATNKAIIDSLRSELVELLKGM